MSKNFRLGKKSGGKKFKIEKIWGGQKIQNEIAFVNNDVGSSKLNYICATNNYYNENDTRHRF